jgi:hypothetical protein
MNLVCRWLHRIAAYRNNRWLWSALVVMIILAVALLEKRGCLSVNGGIGSDSICIINSNYPCDCAREHFADVVLINSNHVSGCNAPSSASFSPGKVRQVTIINGNYICSCEQHHGGSLTLVNSNSFCR